MTSRIQVAKRREKVGQLLSKSVTSTKEIAQILGEKYQTIENDLVWIREQTQPWLFGLAGGGYAFDCKTVIDSLLNIELELEEMRQNARKNNDDIVTRIMILRELRDTRVIRLNVEGEGPTLLALKKISQHQFKE